MSVVRSFTGDGTNASPSVYTMAVAMSAGETVVLALRPSSSGTITGVTIGGNAATQDLNGDTNSYIFSYYSASGGETSVAITLSVAQICRVRGVVDNNIDNADRVDNTVAYAVSGEGFVVSHQFDLTAGVPTSGGLLVALVRPAANRTITGTSGTTSAASGSVDVELLYKGSIASGANALNCDLNTAGNLSGMLVSYNYNAAAAGNSNFLGFLLS